MRRTYFFYYCYKLFLPKGTYVLQTSCNLKAATILPLVGLARFKQDPINRGHGALYLYRPPPAGTVQILQNIPGWVSPGALGVWLVSAAAVMSMREILSLFCEACRIHTAAALWSVLTAACVAAQLSNMASSSAQAQSACKLLSHHQHRNCKV